MRSSQAATSRRAPQYAGISAPRLLVHANHFVSPVALAKLKDTGIANTPDSLYRDVRVRDLLAPQIGTLTREAIKTALLDDFATPWSVCRPPRPSLNGTLTATVATIVMEPALGVMEVASLPALGVSFTTYRLEPRRAGASSSPSARATASTGR